MKFVSKVLGGWLITGALVLIPIYLALLLLLKAVKSIGALLAPVVALMPGHLLSPQLAALILVLLLCLLVGMAVRTSPGDALRNWLERALLEKIPGYTLIRSMGRQIAGQKEEGGWRPAMIEIEDALVPGFVIETLGDGRYTVFVPSVPTPMAGAVYVLDPTRVHLLNVSFAQAIKVSSHWGQGAGELVAAMQHTSSNDNSVSRSDTAIPS